MSSEVTRTDKADAAGGKDPQGRTFTIGELAEEFAITPRTIRFYEDQELLAPSRDGMNRVYTYRDRARLKLICRGKRLGFSLAEIKDFLKLYDVDRSQVEQMRYGLAHSRERIQALELQLEDVKQTLVELREMEQAIIDHLRASGVAVGD